MVSGPQGEGVVPLLYPFNDVKLQHWGRANGFHPMELAV